MNHQEQDRVALERTKLAVDLVKHTSTLATGALVIICTFIEKAAVKPSVSIVEALATCLVSLLCCVMLCLTYLYARALEAHSKVRPTSDVVYRWMLLGISLLLTLGLCSLMVYTLEMVKYVGTNPK